jgi:tetratricopeptide (TPR) repeat protein
MSSYGRAFHHRGERLAAVGCALLLASGLSINIALCLPAARATETSRLDSPFVLRQRAFQSALRHSSQTDDIQKTLSLYRLAIERSEKEYGADSSYTAELYYELGSYALDNSKFTLALENLNRAVDLDPNSIAARLKLIRLYEVCAKPNEARKQISQILAKHPESKEGRQLLVSAIQKHDPAAATRQAFQIDRLICPSANSSVNARRSPTQTSNSVATKNDATKGTANVSGGPENDRETGLAVVNSVMWLRAPHSGKLSDTAAKKLDATTMSKSPAKEKSAEPVAKAKQTKAASPVKQGKAAALSKSKAAHSDKKARHQAKKSGNDLDHIVPESASVETKEDSGAGSKGTGAESAKKGKAAHQTRSSKASSKIPKGLVPPPPPTQILPVYPGMVPALHPSGFRAPAQLRTEAKLKNSAQRKDDKGKPDTKSGAKEDKAEAQEEKSKPSEKHMPAAPMTRDSGDSDPDFLLKWADVNKKKK